MSKLPAKFRLKQRRLYYDDISLGDCYREIDGYYVYYPDGDGYFDAWVLRGIAECLDALNSEIDKQIKNK